MQQAFDAVLQKYPHAHREDLIPILQDIQDQCGHLSEEAVVAIGRYLNLPAGKIYGLATFYNQFRFETLGKYHIQICNGPNCHIEGAQETLQEFEKQLKIKTGEITRNGLFSIESVSCLGACCKAPVVAINEDYYTGVKPEDVDDIIHIYLEKEENQPDDHE